MEVKTTSFYRLNVSRTEEVCASSECQDERLAVDETSVEERQLRDGRPLPPRSACVEVASGCRGDDAGVRAEVECVVLNARLRLTSAACAAHHVLAACAALVGRSDWSHAQTSHFRLRRTHARHRCRDVDASSTCAEADQAVASLCCVLERQRRDVLFHLCHDAVRERRHVDNCGHLDPSDGIRDDHDDDRHA